MSTVLELDLSQKGGNLDPRKEGIVGSTYFSFRGERRGQQEVLYSYKGTVEDPIFLLGGKGRD